MRPLFVVVSGPPGSGKSTLSRPLAGELGLPLIDRDDFKDTAFDVLGWSDREWSRRVGAMSWELVFLVVDRLLSAGMSLVADSNFSPRETPRLCEIRDRHDVRMIEVHCSAPLDTLADRFVRRWETGGRHPGHAPWDREGFLDEIGRRDLGPTGVADHTLELDTTGPVDVCEVTRSIKEVAGGHEDG